jgi:Bifunctional DNA primase/polymerase, N-terminal
MNNIAVPNPLRKEERAALEGALAVAFFGLPAFPCNAEKRPACERGFYTAARSPVELRKLWAMSPGVLVGVPTGQLTNLSVIDIDAKHPEARAWFEENRTRLGPTRVHRTRSGGLHLLYIYQPHLRNSQGKLALGVDVRSAGGYIIWWPCCGGSVLDDRDPAPFPPWLWEALKPPPAPRRPLPPRKPGQRDDNVMRGLVRRLVNAREGERNGVLFWCACRAGEHVHAGEAREGYAIECLERAAAHVGLSQREARRTIASGMKRGPK